MTRVLLAVLAFAAFGYCFIYWPLHTLAVIGFLTGASVFALVCGWFCFNVGRGYGHVEQAEAQRKAIAATWKTEDAARASVGVVLAPFDPATRLRILRDLTQGEAVKAAARSALRPVPVSKGA